MLNHACNRNGRGGICLKVRTFRKFNGNSQVDDSLHKEHQLVHNGVLLLSHQHGLLLFTQSRPQLQLKAGNNEMMMEYKSGKA